MENQESEQLVCCHPCCPRRRGQAAYLQYTLQYIACQCVSLCSVQYLSLHYTTVHYMRAYYAVVCRTLRYVSVRVEKLQRL